MQTSNQPESSSQLQGFDDFVYNIMQDWKVPGLAIAIIKNGETIFSQGFGLRDTANNQKVTPNTLFPIASCTKAFTTTSMSILVDEGKLDWDTPVRQYLPTFKLYDNVATERITPRDLVSHRSGLPRHDFMWYHSSASRQELFDRLQYLEPTKDLRTLWQYQNLMYMVAGYLIGHLTGGTWEDFVQKHIFDPLIMKSSNFSIIETTQKVSDFSHPYREIHDEVQEIPFYAAQGSIAPAGAIVSNITDMSKWLLLNLNKGKYNGTQIVSASQIAQLQSPQMIVPEVSKYPEMPYPSYGLGWFIIPYCGHPMIHHGGNIDGFSSLVTLLPQDNIGIIVLTNLSTTPVPGILTYNICDRLLNLDEISWSERFKKEHEEMKTAEKKGKEKTEADRIPGTSPSHPLEAYTGDYEHPGYGILSIELDGDQLKGTFNTMTFPLKHYHYDFFELEIEAWDLILKVSFSTNVKGDIDSLTAPLESTAKDITFKRIPQKEMKEKAFLEQFVGLYDIMSTTMTVALKGDNALTVTIPGQPDYELVPYKGTEFHVKGLSGFAIEFKSDGLRAVTEVIITQPYGVFTAKKRTD